MKTVATINFKGGVGKTTVTWCIGDFLATYSNSKVILFDLDAQMSMTQAIALDADGNCELIQRQIGNRLAQPAVLKLKVLQALHLLDLQPTELLAPPIIRHLAGGGSQ